MHAGQFGTLAGVRAHDNTAPAALAGHSELNPLRLIPREMQQIIAFPRTRSGPLAVAPEWRAAPAGDQ